MACEHARHVSTWARKARILPDSVQRQEISYLNYMICYFAFVSLVLPFEKRVWVVVSLYWMLWITKYTALLHSNKRKIVMTSFHRFQGSLVIYFNLFYLFFTLWYYKQLYYKLSYKFCIYGVSQNYSCSGWDLVFIFSRYRLIFLNIVGQ